MAVLRRPFPGWVALGLLAALPLSCSDLPTKPLSLVTVTGIIQDRDGGPVELVRIWFRNVDRVPLSSRTRPDPHLEGSTGTGPDGAYTIQLYEGTYEVYLGAPRYSGYDESIEGTVRVAPGAARFDYRYTGVRIHGRIYGPGGTSLPGARAAAFQLGPQGQYISSRAAVDRGSGFYMLAEPGRYDFHVYSDGTDGIPNRGFRGIVIGADTTVEFHLDGFPVTGTVRGPDAEPLQGVYVEAYAENAECASPTGADGSYLLHLPEGVYRWGVQTQGELAYISSREFPPTNITGPMVYDFPLGGVRWAGKVRVLPDSTPARGYWVFANTETFIPGDAHTWSDSTGAFRLVVLPGQLYSIEIEEPISDGMYWILNRVIAGGDSTLDVLLDPAAGRRHGYYYSRGISPNRQRNGDRIPRSWSPGAP